MKFIKNNYLYLIFPLLSLIGAAWQGQFTNDGYHWGFVFSNAIDLLEGKTPYREIFIEYGLISTLLHAAILKIFNLNIYSIIIFTSLLYSFSIYIIGKVTEEFTQSRKYAFFSTFIIFLIYPWPVSPWPNFISFFLITIFCFFYTGKKKKDYIASGLSLALAYLSFTIVYNFIITFFLLALLIIILINYKKINYIILQKHLYIFLSFFSILILFFVYLFAKEIMEDWLIYQYIPFLQANYYKITIVDQVVNYISFLSIHSISRFIYEPQFIIFSLIFFSNIYLILNILIKSYRKNLTIENFNLLIINLLIFSLNIYSQLLDIDKFGTSLSLGIISLMYVISRFHNKDNKIIINFSIIFIAIYSFVFAFDLSDSKYGGSRAAYYKDLKNYRSSYNEKKISFFSNQKWNESTWFTLNSFINIQKELKKNCDIKYGANLTSNTFLYTLLEYKKIQLIPFFFKRHGHIYRNYFEPNLIINLQKKINKNNIIIVSNENNDKKLDFTNYKKIKILDSEEASNYQAKFLYVFYPSKCGEI